MLAVTGLSSGLVALAFAIAAYAASLVYKSKRGENLSDMQDKAVNALNAELTLRDAKIEALEQQNNRQQAQIDAQSEQIAILKQLPTAKIDVLRDEVAVEFKKVNGKLDRLAAAH